MLVVSLTDCPPRLRGDLTKWLQEISPGVYAGNVNARIRDEIWKRVKTYAGAGRATMVFTARNEQGMDFRVHQTGWQPIDFDGFKLMMRPSKPSSAKNSRTLGPGFSKSSAASIAKRVENARLRKAGDHPSDYVVLDLETTGLSPVRDEIIEIGVLKISGNTICDRFHALVRTQNKIPPEVEKLTGIHDDMLQAFACTLSEALPKCLCFIGELPIVCHNAPFDYEFLRMACTRCALTPPVNRAIDTYRMARVLIDDVENYHLSTLAHYFGIASAAEHRSLPDCETTWKLYEKLIEIQR